jgi:hypothetical protein
MGAYDNPTVAPMVNVGKIIGDNIERIQQAQYLAAEQKKKDKILLETGAIERTNAFEGQALDLKRKETSIENMNEVASMMVDKYYDNEKNYASKKIDADEYRRIRQNLWNNLNQYQSFQKNTVMTLVNYKKDSENNSVSESAQGLQKKKRLEAFKARKATIVAGDDGRAMIRIYTPNSIDGKETELFERPLEEYVSNPDILSYDKKADLKSMTKTMGELAKASLHDSSSYDIIRTGNLERYFYNMDKAKQILKNDDDLVGFVSANLESIVEDYMPDEKVFIPDTPQTRDAYIKQLEEAKDWYSEYIYLQTLGREAGRKAIPQPKSARLPKTTKPKVETDVNSEAAESVRNWDLSNAGLVDINPSLKIVGKTVFQNGKPIVKWGSNDDEDDFKRKVNIALGYVKPAPKPSPTKK